MWVWRRNFFRRKTVTDYVIQRQRLLSISSPTNKRTFSPCSGQSTQHSSPLTRLLLFKLKIQEATASWKLCFACQHPNKPRHTSSSSAVPGEILSGWRWSLSQVLIRRPSLYCTSPPVCLPSRFLRLTSLLWHRNIITFRLDLHILALAPLRKSFDFSLDLKY